MGPPSYMRPLVDRNVVMLCMTMWWTAQVCSFIPGLSYCYPRS